MPTAHRCSSPAIVPRLTALKANCAVCFYLNNSACGYVMFVVARIIVLLTLDPGGLVYSYTMQSV